MNWTIALRKISLERPSRKCPVQWPRQRQLKLRQEPIVSNRSHRRRHIVPAIHATILLLLQFSSLSAADGENVPGAAGSASSQSATSQAGQPQGGTPPEQIGVPPERPQPQFLRDQSVLLTPGEFQFEFGFTYNQVATLTPISFNLEDSIVVSELRTIRNNIFTPLELRIGLQPGLQGSVQLPVGYSSLTLTAGNSGTDAEDWGIGDLALGLTKVLREPETDHYTLLGSFSASAPTGESTIPATQQLPGASLGSGFWSISSGLTAIRSYDPVVTFVNLSYTHTFDTDFLGGSLDPGNVISYRLGLGYAVNSRVTMSTSFNGGYIGESEANGQGLTGTSNQPFSLRLAATIIDRERSTQGRASLGKRATEPFVSFGLSPVAPQTSFGIRWTF